MSKRRMLRGLVIGLPVLAAIGLVLGGCPINGGPTEPNTTEPNTTEPNTVTPGNSGLTGKYVGSARCGQCHNSFQQKWSGTLHAGALATLEAIGQGTNAQCLPCHTVGYGQTGGFVDHATTDALAGVGCENCHGPGGDHVSNIENASLRPTIDIHSSVCGECHTDSHHPTYDDWQTSAHGAFPLSSVVLEEFEIGNAAGGTGVSNCGNCHSGDYFVTVRAGEKSQNGFTAGTMDNFALQGTPVEQIARVECAVCHNPHQRTNNASSPDTGRDFQLRFPEVKAVTPTNTEAAATDPTRFNLCGQCHHARTNYTWQATSRTPHPSMQANFYFGEMSLPVSAPDPIVPSRTHVHVSAPDQCATCHVYRASAQEGIAPAVSGHTFEVNFNSCAASGCHVSAAGAQALFNGMKGETDSGLAAIKAALDAWSATNHYGWEYKANPGGPEYKDPNTNVVVPGLQAKIPPDIKKARYLYYYAMDNGGEGVHNPTYMRAMLEKGLIYATTTQTPLP